MSGNALKRLIKPLLSILLLHIRQIGRLADVDGTDPPVGVPPVHLGVGFWVRLGRVADADEFALGEPAVDLVDAVGLVSLGTLGERLEEAAEEHPGVVAQDEAAGLVMVVDELVEERVEVVGRGGEVEPGWVLKLIVDHLVEFRHASNGFRFIGEGGLQDTDGAGGFRDFNGVVDVGDYAPAFRSGKVSTTSNVEAWNREVNVRAVRFFIAASEFGLRTDTVCV